MSLMKYIGAAESAGKEAPGISEIIKKLLGHGSDLAGKGMDLVGKHPLATGVLGGAAGVEGFHDLKDDDDDDDIVNLDALQKKGHELSPLLKKYMGR